MSAVIIGSPLSGAKVLQRQNYQRENNGLETITENYIIRTTDRLTLAPSKDTLHSAFSTATPKYSRMAVETITFDEMDGGLTIMSVVYVGLTSSTGLPQPVVRLIPTAGEGIYGPPIVIEAEYVTDVSETQFMAGQLALNSAMQVGLVFSNTIKMPAVINGYQMPRDPRSTYSESSSVASVQYSGYCVLSKSCDRRGLFLVARDTFHEVLQVAAVT